MILASIEIVTDVRPHPNADRLDIVTARNYNCITSRGAYDVGSAVVLIQPDTVIPSDAPWAQPFLKYCKDRVRALKIRGVYSFGIIVSPYDVFDLSAALKFHLQPTQIGVDLSEAIGVTKYESPQPQSQEAIGPLPFQMYKTDEDRYQLVELPYGELVDVTLKVDGSSSTYYCKNVDDTWVTGICSRTQELRPDCNNMYTNVDKRYGILDKLLTYCSTVGRSLALRGEVYGKGVQSKKNNFWSKDAKHGWVGFSVLDLETLKYDPNPHEIFMELGLPEVPYVETKVPLTQELIKKYAEELTEVAGTPFEGVVIRHAGGTFKVINLHYDSQN